MTPPREEPRRLALLYVALLARAVGGLEWIHI